MKTPIRSPLTSAPELSIANGDSHDRAGSIDPSGADPEATLTSATPANSSRASTWAKIITFCTRAESSVPSTQIKVISAMITTAIAVTVGFDAAAESSPRNNSP